MCLCFRLNYLLAGGLNPLGFHVLNIALHSAISVLMIDVFAILMGGMVSQAPKSSFLAALLFAVHPVHTESVSTEAMMDSDLSCCREKCAT